MKNDYKLERKCILLSDLSEKQNDIDFWFSKSATERLDELEFLGKIMYGYYPPTNLLQRF